MFQSCRSIDECGSTCLNFENNGNKCMGFTFDHNAPGNSYGTCSFLQKYERGILTSKYARNPTVTVWTTNNNLTVGKSQIKMNLIIYVDKKRKRNKGVEWKIGEMTSKRKEKRVLSLLKS